MVFTVRKRAIDILKIMVKDRKPITAKEISFRGKLPLPTVHQTIKVLEESRLIEKEKEESGEAYWKVVPREKANKLILQFIDEILDQVYAK
ncbi:MAG: helix-turn-helix domain-containing protein [Euryarchaeota archaeon]|nr:helix-turn-helix domain-containing protein [Euryarchaeota archaeon]